VSLNDVAIIFRPGVNFPFGPMETPACSAQA
jgi:hypothetical protein